MTQHNSRRTRRHSSSSDDGNGNNKSSNNQDVPFRDGDPEIGELPLDEIDTFMIPARDEKGTVSHLSCNVPPFMERYIQIVIRSYRFPYLKPADLIRHAIWRHLHWLADIRQTLPKHPLAGMDAVLEICRDDEIRVQTENAFERLNERIQAHYLQHNYGEAIRILSLVKTRIDNVQPSPWKTKFLTELWRRHGHMLNLNGKVKSEAQLQDRTPVVESETDDATISKH